MMRRTALLSMSLLALGLANTPSATRADLIVNGGFEDPVLSPGAAILFTPGQAIGSGWTVVGDPGTNIVLIQATYGEPGNGVNPFNPQEGLNSIDITGGFNTGPTAGVEQTVATVAGLAYTISFYVGRATPTGGPGGAYPGPATIDLSIDGGPRTSFTNSDITLGELNWKQFSETFTAAGSSTTITFFNGTPIATNEAGLDNVSLNLRSVPEPASVSMLCVGAITILGFGRRRRTEASPDAA